MTLANRHCQSSACRCWGRTFAVSSSECDGPVSSRSL